MKKFFVIFLFLLLLGVIVGAVTFFMIDPSLLIKETPKVTEEVGDQLQTSETKKVDDPFESELAELLSDYNVRKNDVGYLHLISEKLLERRQTKKAKRYLNEALELDPSNVRTMSLLAKVSLLQKDFEQARNYLAELPDDEIHAAFIKALLAVIDNDRDAAGKHLHYIADNFPESELGEKAQRIIDAYREFDYFRDGLPIHLRTLLARSFNQINEPALAIWLLRDVLTEKTDYRDAWILLGYAYYNLQQFSLAEDAFYKAYELDTEKPETQYFLGLTYYALDNLVESERFFEYAVINGFEPRVQAYQKLSDVYLENENYEKAVSMYENYLSLSKDTKPTDFVRPVQIYIDYLNEPENALALAQRVVRTHPNEAMSYNLLGWAYLENKDYANALVNLEKAQLIDSTLPALYLTFGKFYEAQGDLDKAKEEYKKAYEEGDEELVSNQAAERYNALIKND
jgi:cytochrome c-type biogenesis protein CcmH/NrfG